MKGNFQIGRIYGIPITINYSWFFIFVLITWALAFLYFPQTFPELTVPVSVALGVVTSILFFSSVLFHELMHSIIAIRNGLPIEGINLWIFGGVSQMTEEPKSPAIELKMSIAGPLSSFFLGVVFFGLFFIGQALNLGPVVIGPSFWLGFINVALGIFNLLPGFPLDGGRVLRSIVWYFTDNLMQATKVASMGGRGIGYLLILGGFFLVFGGVITGLWFIVLGWVLLQAAESGYQQVLIRQSLEGINVKDIMTNDPRTVEADLSLDELVHEFFLKHRWGAFPVVIDDEVKGIITLHRVREIPREEWSRYRVHEIMRPVSDDIIISPQEDVISVLPKLETKAEGRMLVMENGDLVGIVTRTDVSRLVETKLAIER